MPRPSLLLVVLVVWLAGCGRGEEPVPTDGPIQVTSIPLEAPPGTPSYVPTLDGPLRLLSTTPAGTLETLPAGLTVSVTFSRPMVPLGEVPQPDPQTLTLDPPVPGALRWEGTQTLVFTPTQPLQMATAYEVTLREGLTATDGETLDEPYTWTFETPRPALSTSRPEHQARFASPDSSLRLVFNQPVELRSLQRRAALYRLDAQMERQGTVDVTVEAASDSVFVLHPEERLRQDQNYEIAVEPGVASRVGALASSEAFAVRFRTIPPLRLDEVTQPRRWDEQDTATFDPSRGFTLAFSTPVRFEDLRRALTVTPALDLPPGIEARDGTVSPSHSFPVNLQPETTYTLDIDSLRDQLGQVLPSAQATFRTRAYEPSVSVPSGLLILEAGQESALPIRATNVEQIRLGTQRLSADGIVPWARVYDTQHYYPREDGDTLPNPVAATHLVDLDLERNRPATLPLRLDSLLTDSTGILGLHVRPVLPGTSANQQPQYRALAQVTRLGITGKFSAHQNLIFVADLATATPVEGARVTIRGADNAVYWEGTTDAEGRAQSPGWAALGMEQPNEWEAPTQYAIVEHGGDLAFTASVYRDGLEPYRFDVNYAWQPEPVNYAGTVFSDRGLYQTGETVHLKGILRRRTDRDWQAVQDSVRVLLRDPRNQIVLDRRFLPGDLGTFHFDWTAPTGAAQGVYEARVFLASDTTVTPDNFYADAIGTGSFRVDAFRRATFNVEAHALAPSYVAGDFFEGTISGHYLFGAAMQDQPVTYTLERTAGSYRPPGYDGYLFGHYGYFPGVYRDLVRADTTLDEDGLLRIRTQVPGNEHGAVTRLVWSGTVTDPARQQVTGRTEITLHPGLFYIGLKPRTTYVSLADAETMPVDLITVTPDGYPVGDKPVTLTLIRRQWNSVREIGADGRLRWRSEETEETVAEQRVTSQEGRSLRLDLPIAQGGSYVIRATAQDVRGNRITTEAYFYAAGPGYAAWERRDDDRIELIPEQDTYRPGDTARLMVLSPYEEATALITVEREGILSSRVETLTGSAPQIEIPLTEEHLPNVFVSVVLLNGRAAEPTAAQDAGAPSFKIGYASLRVDPGVRHLRVEVEPDQTDYRPGDEVTVAFRLLDQNGDGVPGEIAFSAADAGVLNLIGYALPDPFDTFYGPRLLGVITTETRANLVRQRSFGQKEEALGGGGGDADAQLRQDFRPLAHWEPALRTDDEGHASLTFRLPESLTTFRLMATAVTANHQFGAGQTDIVVTQPLVLQAALPRFARLDDRFEAGVLVTNTTGSDGTATITAQADGLTLDGDSAKSVTLRNGETKEVRFSWLVPATGEAQLTFTGTLGDEEDALRVPLTLTRPVIKQTAATFASTEDQATEELTVPDAYVPGLGGLEIQLSSTALVGLDGATEYLFTYPYGCLEQRTSAVRPLLVAGNLLDAFDLDALEGDRAEVVAAWLGDLQDFWVGNGFTMWPGSYHVHPYVSAYAVLAMAEADAAGFEVPQDVRRQALDALEEQVRNRSEKPDYVSEAAWSQSRALMLYALARNGRVLAAEIDALATQALAGGLSLGADGESFLIRTIALAGEPALRTHLEPLVDRLRNRLVIEGTTAHLTAPDAPGMDWVFASDVRSTAFGLTALIEAEPSDAMRLIAERMVRYLIRSRRGGAWASTQENAAVVNAFSTYYRTFEAIAPDFAAEVQVAGRTILQEAFRTRSLAVREADVPLDELPDEPQLPVQIRKDGQGHLFYAMRLQTYRNAPVPAAANGLTVERRIQRLDDAGRPVGEEMLTGEEPITLDSGEMVRVILRVRSGSERNYVVVDDALPAGLEVLNTAFETTDSGIVEQARQDTETRWWGSFNHTEIRDDRVVLFADFLDNGTHTYVYVARATTPGTFRHPPVQAELMYQPAINGRTASGTLVVEPPAEGMAQR